MNDACRFAGGVVVDYQLSQRPRNYLVLSFDRSAAQKLNGGGSLRRHC
jgi:hypothetical protein